MNINSYLKISSLLESSKIFYIKKLNKLMNTLLLSADPTDNNLLTYGYFVKALKMENVPNTIISELVHLTSINASDKCQLNGKLFNKTIFQIFLIHLKPGGSEN